MGVCFLLGVLGLTLCTGCIPVTADAEVLPDYQRSVRDDPKNTKWLDSDSQSEDEFVDRIAMMLEGGNQGDSLASQRERLKSLKEKQLQLERKPQPAQLPEPTPSSSPAPPAQVSAAPQTAAARQKDQLQLQRLQQDEEERLRQLQVQLLMEQERQQRQLMEQQAEFQNIFAEAKIMEDAADGTDDDDLSLQLTQQQLRQLRQQRELQLQLQQDQQQRQDHRKAMLLQQQHDQDVHQQMLLQEQLSSGLLTLAGLMPAQRAQLQVQSQGGQVPAQLGQLAPQFTYSFPHPKSPEESSRFAISPSDPRYYQPDLRLHYFSRQEPNGEPSGRPDEDLLYDETSSGGGSLRGQGGPEQRSSEQHQQHGAELPDDAAAAPAAGGDDFGDEDDDFVLGQHQQVAAGAGGRPQQHSTTAAPARTRNNNKFGAVDLARMVSTSSQDSPVKKQLTFPKDHWFFGMDDVYKLAIVIGCSTFASAVIIGTIIWQYRLHRNAKAAADVEYPAYGVTGPNKEVSPTGDRRLAQSAQMYHYQHQKQQILAMESRASGAGGAGGRRGSMSEAESDEENEEGDYTVYECPGLAPTGEMEVKNPLFQDDPTPATPAAGASAQTTKSEEDNKP